MTAALGRDQRPTICHAQDRYVGWSGRGVLQQFAPPTNRQPWETSKAAPLELFFVRNTPLPRLGVITT
jgi:hypothetical protein